MFESIIGIAFLLALFGTSIALVGLSLKRLNPKSIVWRHCVVKSAVISIFLGAPLLVSVSPWFSLIDVAKQVDSRQESGTQEIDSGSSKIQKDDATLEPIPLRLSQKHLRTKFTDFWQRSERSRYFIGSAFLLIWSTGLIYGLGRLINSMIFMHQSVANSTRPKSVELTRLQRLRPTCDASTLSHVRLSSSISIPCLAGFLAPLVLLPNQLLASLSDEELNQVLSHEFAHRKRHDQITILINQIVRMLFWWNPFVRLLHHELSRTCEEICDNHVLVNDDATSYSTTLCKLAGFVTASHGKSDELCPSLLGTNWRLEHRVRDLLSESRDTRLRIEKRHFLPVMLAFTTTLILAVGLGHPICHGFVTSSSQIQERTIPIVHNSKTKQKNDSDQLPQLIGQAGSSGGMKFLSQGSVVFELEGQDADRATLHSDQDEWSIKIDDELVFRLSINGFDPSDTTSKPFRLGAPYAYSSIKGGGVFVNLTRKPTDGNSFQPTGFVSCVGKNGNTYVIRF